jgi:hypothetical protein
MCFGFFVLAISTTQVSFFPWSSADDPQFKISASAAGNNIQYSN